MSTDINKLILNGTQHDAGHKDFIPVFTGKNRLSYYLCLWLYPDNLGKWVSPCNCIYSVIFGVSSSQFYSKAWQSHGYRHFLSCIHWHEGMMIVADELGRTWKDVVMDYSKLHDVIK